MEITHDNTKKKNRSPDGGEVHTTANPKATPSLPRNGEVEVTLADLGYLYSKANSPFPYNISDVKKAMKEFQSRNGLSPTGEIDKKSIDLLIRTGKEFRRELDHADRLYTSNPSEKNLNHLFGVIKKYCVDANQIIADLKRERPDVKWVSRLSLMYGHNYD